MSQQQLMLAMMGGGSDKPLAMPMMMGQMQSAGGAQQTAQDSKESVLQELVTNLKSSAKSGDHAGEGDLKNKLMTEAISILKGGASPEDSSRKEFEERLKAEELAKKELEEKLKAGELAKKESEKPLARRIWSFKMSPVFLTAAGTTRSFDMKKRIQFFVRLGKDGAAHASRCLHAVRTDSTTFCDLVGTETFDSFQGRMRDERMKRSNFVRTRMQGSCGK